MMDTEKMEPEEETHSLSSYELLHLAENHLRLRNYSLSSQYALECLHSNAGHDYGRSLRHRAQQIAAVSDILSSASETLDSPYSVLGVDTFCSDVNLIRSKLKSMLLLLDPLRSTFPPAEEAMRSAWKAWNVLGNPDKKSELDARLNSVLLAAGGAEVSDSNFWTVCPYCYFTYEYARVYEGYCLRCQNGACRRVFQGLSIPTPPPPVASNQDAFFTCFAFFPLGLEGAARNNAKKWSPFAGMPEDRTAAKRKGLDDDDDDDENAGNCMGSEEDSEQTGCGIPGNGNIGSHVPTGPKMLMQRGGLFQMNKSASLSDDMGNGGVDDGQGNFDRYGFISEGGCTRAGGYDECRPEADMQFVEKDGEIFLEVSPGDDED